MKKLLIFEDEIPAFHKLESTLKNSNTPFEILGWAKSIDEAKTLIKEHKDVDLILSDIELLDGNSLSIFENESISTPIIFITAFDQYLLRAFKTNGIAYLLKPYSLEDFNMALEKFQLLFNTKQESIDRQLLTELRTAIEKRSKRYKQRFTIKKKNGIHILGTEEIPLFKANGDFVLAFDSECRKHVINAGISQIVEMIDPGKFFRINRSEIIQYSFIDKIESYFKNRLIVKLKGIDDQCITSTSKTPDFRKWLDQ